MTTPMACSGAPYSFKPRERREFEGEHRLAPGYYEVKLKYGEPNERALLEVRSNDFEQVFTSDNVYEITQSPYYYIAGSDECFDDSNIDWTVPPIQLKRAE